MNYCKKCESQFEGKGEFCLACVDAIKRGKAQTKELEPKKPKKKGLKDKLESKAKKWKQ